jgi:dTDP-4-dehydrorhamnose reductase
VDVATATAALLPTERYGLYHVTNAGSCSWYEFARTIFQAAGATADLTAIPSREYPAPARRPGYSVLAAGAYQALALPPVRHWSDAVAAYLEERRHKAVP